MCLRKRLLCGALLLYNTFVRVRLPAAIFVVWMTGCASQPVHSTSVTQPPLQPDRHSVPDSTAVKSRRVALPYTFSRHGVEIRVNSIEFSEAGVLVNITLQETRGQTLDFHLSTLMHALTTTGQALPYAGYRRAGKTQTDSAIHLAAGDQFALTLNYASAPAGADTPLSAIELRFPTGKYWSSLGN